MSDKLYFTRHPNDHGIDEILFCAALPETHEQAEATAFLRIVTRERYKTSELSGDEWRFSAVLQLREHPTAQWVSVSSGFRDPEACAAFLYAELFGDFRAGGKHEWLYRRRVAAIAFAWKGLPVWSASYDGEPTDLLVACGHLPSALIRAGEEGTHHHDALSRLCCQPGCRQPLVSVYRRKKEYCGRCGTRAETWKPEHRGFCTAHLRRGNCALDDADRNYEVVSGPGPEGNEPDPDKVRRSAFGGVIDVGGAA